MISNRILRRAALSALVTVFAAASALGQSSGKRVTYYYQTQYYQGNYVSLAPIWEQKDKHTGKPKTTDVMVAAFHLGYNADNTPYIHLNDNPPNDPMFDVMWRQVRTLQKYGVTARMMLGGAAQGSYADLFDDWSTFYPILKKNLRRYRLNGIDLDVEEDVSLPNIRKLIRHLNADFGDQFIITLAPVASALWGGANLSGFDYMQLYQSPEGKMIAWFNGQFYSGFATLQNPTDYEKVVQFGFPAEKVVAGMIGNPSDGGGYVSISVVAQTIQKLVAEYPDFGGADAWEYFNCLPGGLANPVQWANVMTKAMGD